MTPRQVKFLLKLFSENESIRGISIIWNITKYDLFSDIVSLQLSGKYVRVRYDRLNELEMQITISRELKDRLISD